MMDKKNNKLVKISAPTNPNLGKITPFFLTLWHTAAFGDFREKTLKRTWLCAGISTVQ